MRGSVKSEGTQVYYLIWIAHYLLSFVEKIEDTNDISVLHCVIPLTATIHNTKNSCKKGFRNIRRDFVECSIMYRGGCRTKGNVSECSVTSDCGKVSRIVMRSIEITHNNYFYVPHCINMYRTLRKLHNAVNGEGKEYKLTYIRMVL